jgi:hypothetical protein
MKKFLIFIFILFVQLNKARASHAMGADITYSYVGPNQYLVTFSFYRDCSGIPAPSLLDLDIDNSCGFVVPSVYLVPTILSPTQFSPLCPSSISTCNGGTFTGLEEWVYTGIVTLPGPCADWNFSHSESARNTAITTTNFGGNLFVYAKLNNLNGIINSSPTFSNKPVPFACVGQTFNFNHAAYDAEGDSLVYEIITPRTGPSLADTISFTAPYTPTQPILSNPPMSFDMATGDFSMKPTQTDVSILAVLVNEFRGGVLIGQVERDIQITVLNCNNDLPIVTGVNGSPIKNIFACTNEQNCFYITAIDADATNSTQLTWDNSIPGMTITNSGGTRDTAFFCWTPSISDTTGNPYYFTVTANDDNCPYFGVVTSTFSLTVDTSANCSPTIINTLPKNPIDIKVFPQPALDNLFVDLGSNFFSNKGYSIRIIDIPGRIVFQSNVKDQKSTIDVHSMKGVYYLSITDKEGNALARRKIIIL